MCKLNNSKKTKKELYTLVFPTIIRLFMTLTINVIKMHLCKFR